MKRILLPFFLVMALLSAARADVSISEFLANNNTGLTDEDGARADWIELYCPCPGLVDYRRVSVRGRKTRHERG